MELVDFERNLRGKLHVFFVLKIKIVSSLGGCDQGRFKQLRMSCFHPSNWVNQSEMGRKKQIKDQQRSCPKGATHGSRELLDNWEFHGWLILLHPRPSSDESHWHDWLNCLMVIRGVVLLYIISYISYIYIHHIYICISYLFIGDIWGPLWPLSQWASHVRQVNGFGVANPDDAECRGTGLRMIKAQLDLVYIAKVVEMVKVSSNVGETIINPQITIDSLYKPFPKGWVLIVLPTLLTYINLLQLTNLLYIIDYPYVFWGINVNHWF